MINARYALMMTYVYGFYLDSKNIAIFEFNQADFEMYCENLHSFVELNVYPSIKKGNKFTDDERMKILNLYNNTK